MTLTIDSEPAPAPIEPGPGPDLRRRRTIAMTIWAVGFTAWWFLLGLPLTDPILTFLWLWAGTVAWRINRPRRTHLKFARDWLPIVLLLEVYNFSRGLADNLGAPHV